MQDGLAALHPGLQGSDHMSSVKRAYAWLNKPEHCAYLFLAPSLLLLLVFNIAPLIMAFVLSLFNVNMTMSQVSFAALDNFKEAISDPRFINSLKVTATLAAVELPMQVFGAMVIAAFLTKNTFRNKFYRAIYFLPVICSATAIGIMWKMILHSNIGFVTYVIRKLGMGKINFLNTPGLTIFVVAGISMWRSLGISIIIYVTAIQQVDPQMYEAAEIDGAGKIRQFLSITIPSIRPTFWYILLTRFSGALQIFDIIYTTTNGGPNFTTESTVSYIYTRAFTSGGRMGYASAMSVLLFFIIMLVTIVLYRRMNKEDA